ncbi:MAG: SprB repeat-containing protein, partial [Bacteroidota bacterium]
MKRINLLKILILLVAQSIFNATSAQVFNETIGDATGAPPANNNAISFWEGDNRFDNDGFIMTGSTSSNATVRNNNDSQGSLSAGNHIFLSRNSAFFQISGINTLNISPLQLSFYIRRGSSDATFQTSTFKVEVSTDGTNWSLLSTPHTTSTTWQSIIANGTIPSTQNLRIRFTQSTAYAPNSSTNNYFYRLDDIRLNVACTPVDLSGTTSHLSCFGGNNGSIDISASGSGTISYSWSNGAASQDLTGLSAGNYTVTATNACSNTSLSFTISQPELLVAAAATSDYNGWGVSCKGYSNGFVAVSASGGTAPYSGAVTYTNLSAGTYSYTVTDANNCSSTTSITVSEPSLLTANAAVSDDINCNGETGVITVFAAGGTTPYSG